jgi:hypothetical protein
MSDDSGPLLTNSVHSNPKQEGSSNEDMDKNSPWNRRTSDVAQGLVNDENIVANAQPLLLE